MSGLRRVLVSGGVVVVVAAGLLTAGALGGAPTDRPAGTVRAQLPTNPLDRSIAVAQARLERQPQDFRTWAALAIDYVEKARLTVDPTFYAKAEGAAARSLELDRTTNDVGYTALAILKNAEHDFPAALAAARKGLALNDFSSTLYGTLADAQIQLGRYDDAARSVDRMNALQPGVAAFTRASYVLELRGDVKGARAALDQALAVAQSPSEKAFTRTYLGELSLNYGGDAKAALAQFEAGLAEDPRDVALQAGRAKALLGVGRTDEAKAAYAKVAETVPSLQYVQEYGELLQSLGDPEAERQFALFGTLEDLFRSNNVILDTEPALFEADHGSPQKALQRAAEGWKARPFVEMADAYAWAMYVNGRYREALAWSDRALVTGWPNALFSYHRGMIQKALGDEAAARKDLARALELNPRFSSLHAPKARAALAELS